MLILNYVTKKQGQALHPLQALGICGHAPKLPGCAGRYSSTGALHQITMGYPQQNALSLSQRGNEGVLLPCAPCVSSPREASSRLCQRHFLQKILNVKLKFISEKHSSQRLFLDHFKVEVNWVGGENFWIVVKKMKQDFQQLPELYSWCQ